MMGTDILHTSLFTRPEYFLLGLDAEAGKLIFVETSEAIIRRSAFLDGRTPVSIDGRRHSVPLKAAIDWQVVQPARGAGRMLFHTSFCGSTLLSHYLQSSSTVLVYREPAILAELASLKAEKHKISQKKGQWRTLVAFTCGQMQKSWSHVPTLVKPSNWANPLIPDLMAQASNQYALRMSLSVEDYLLANLRGGKARLSFSLDLLNHLLKAGLVNRADVLEVERGGYSPTGRLLRLLSILHEAQSELLEANLPDADCLSLNQLRDDPRRTISRAGKSLGLSVDQTWAEQAVVKMARQHAKDPDAQYDLRRELAENRRLQEDLAAEFEDLSDWRDNQMRDVG